MAKVRKKKKGLIKKLIIAIFVELLLVAGLFIAFGLKKIGRNDQDDHKIVENAETEKVEGFRNIVVFGVDNRENNKLERGNSDTIIIVSINNKTKDVKLASIYRDTYTKIADEDNKYTKINAAYSKGGYSLALSTINKNFDMNLSEYVTIDFDAVINVVDSLGGITLDITEKELKWLNIYIRELNRINGTKVAQIKTPGTQEVNGTQATAWSRIRYTDDDFKRTERQRTVITKIFKKVKSAGPIKAVQLYNKLAPQILTNLKDLEMANIAKDVFSYNIKDQTGFPFEKVSEKYNGLYYVFPINLADNVSKLHAFLFDKTGYVPSNTVQEYSSHIESIRKQ